MGDSNRVALRYVKESTFGTTPATPTMQNMRFTQESFELNTSSVTSQEIRSDRQVADVIRTDVAGQGGFNFELSAGTYDDMILAAIQASAWSSPVSLTGLTLTVAAGANTITRSTGSWVSDGIVTNQWVKFGGFTNAANNGFFKVTVTSATVLTITNPTGVLVNEGPVTSCTANMGSQAVNGTSFTSFTIEKEFTDLANEFAYYRGMSPETWSLNTAKGGVITGSFSFMGVNEVSGAATLASSTTAATTTSVMNAIDDAKLIAVNGGVYDVTELAFALKNNLRAREIVGYLGAKSMGSGTIDVTGSHKAYYASKTEMDRYLNAGYTGIAQVLYKNSGGYVIEFPSAKYTSGRRVAGGINQDIMADMAFTARRDPTEGITIRVARF